MIKHIEFWCSNIERSMRFYNSFLPLLGWKQISPDAFSDGNTKIYFNEREVEMQNSVGPRHICFLAPSKVAVDKIDKQMQANDFTILKAPSEYEHNGKTGYSIDLEDPDGYFINISIRAK